MTVIINTTVYNETGREAIDTTFFAGSSDMLVAAIENSEDVATVFLRERLNLETNDVISVKRTETQAHEVLKPMSGSNELFPTIMPIRDTERTVESWVWTWNGHIFKQLAHERLDESE